MNEDPRSRPPPQWFNAGTGKDLKFSVDTNTGASIASKNVNQLNAEDISTWVLT
jgi:hypothetical protein